MDFMRAKSEMDAVAEARIQGNKKAAELIVKTVVNTYNTNRKNPMVARKQLDQLLTMVPLEDRLEIMIEVFFKMC